MKIGFAVIARLQSSRLKEKHLLPVLGQPILSFLLQRISMAFIDELVITTADEPDNRRLEAFAEYGAKVFYGSSTNIPLRLLQTCKTLGYDAVVSVDGDDILCATGAMRSVRSALEKGSAYVATEGLPLGMNVAGYTQEFLAHALSNHEKDALETGWGRIFDKEKLEKLSYPTKPEYDLLRFTLDYHEDFSFFSSIINHFGAHIDSASDQEIIDYAIASKAYTLNEAVAKKYWEDFQRNVSAEQQS